jgi:P-type E1-E2 ATPase
VPGLVLDRLTMSLRIAIPGLDELELDQLLLDVNGTLTDRGELIDGVGERIARLREALEITLVSADTFGTLDRLAERLNVTAQRVGDGRDKLRVLERLGAKQCAVIGNGANDVPALSAAGLGFAVLGAEGASAAALSVADVVCRSVTDALDLLLDPTALAATLRP